MTTTMTIRLDARLKKHLEKLASATRRSKSFLAVEAIQRYIEINAWQVQEIRTALAEADAGDLATDAEVKAVFNKWNRRAR